MTLNFLRPAKPPKPRHWTAHAEKHIKPYVLRRDAYWCQIQGERCLGVATVVDHILPRSKGGSELPENLRAACAPCNWERGNRDEEHPVFRARGVVHPCTPLSLSPRRPSLLLSGDYSRKPVNGRR